MSRRNKLIQELEFSIRKARGNPHLSKLQLDMIDVSEKVLNNYKGIEAIEAELVQKKMAKKFGVQKTNKQMNNLIGVSGKIKDGKDLVGEMLLYIGDNVGEPTYEGFELYVNLDPRYTIKKCADKLKDAICVILGCTRAQLEDRDYKEKELSEEWWCYQLGDGTLLPRGYYPNKPDNDMCEERYLVKLTPRKILQIFGTQGGRMVVHPNIWVNALFADYNSYSARGSEYEFEKSHWIITDIRFPENEGKAVSSRGGLLIGIKRLFNLRFPEYTELNDAEGYDIPEELGVVNPELYKNLMHESETSMGDHSWCDVIIENNGTIEELFNNVLKAVQ